MLLLRKNTATVIITVTLEGAKLAIGDAKKLRLMSDKDILKCML